MHHIDRLAEIRQQIRALRQEARQIRALILAGEVSNQGDNYTALVHQRVLLVDNIKFKKF